MKKSIKDFELNNKKLLMRVDFNVPMDGSEITDDTRIKAALDSINYAIESGAKLILFSHLCRVNCEEDKCKYSLEPIAVRLGELLNKEVIFPGVTKGSQLEEKINEMNAGDVLLVENTRFEDLDSKKESSCNEELGAYWASLGDIFINDAFATSHRKHASNVGIASNLPSGIGFLIEKELSRMNFKNMERPIGVIFGGAKVHDKVKVIEEVGKMADYILIGGAMAYTFLMSQGIKVGSSLVDKESIEFAKRMLEEYSDKIVLPIDTVVADGDKNIRTSFVNEIKGSEEGFDIGYNTAKLFRSYLESCKTVIWNGPLGMFEVEPFNEGTLTVAKYLSELDCKTIVGGGDTAYAIKDYKNSFYHVSTGGGASLKLLEGASLPGIEIIDDKN